MRILIVPVIIGATHVIIMMSDDGAEITKI